jgi:hypothetical protein
MNNSTAAWIPELRRLLAIWWKSGPNLDEMLKADFELNQKLKEDFRAVWLPTQSGRSYMVFSPHGDPRDMNSTARAFFITITLSPEGEKFAGPCPRCQKYFVRQTAKPSVYCSRRCASQDTAIRRTLEVRKQQYENKLRVAKVAIAKWESLSSQRRAEHPWKEYVAGYDPAAEITPKFLTRAVNDGALSAPKPETKARKEKPR